MQRAVLLLSVLLSSLPIAVYSQGLCFGSQSSLFDTWCNNNCNNNPPFCPSSFCSCASGPAPTPSQSPNLASGTCRSLMSFLPDSWCTNMCHHSPPFCPQSYCDCQTTPEPSPVVLSEHLPGCCNQNKELFFVDNFNVYTVTIDANTKLPISPVTLCAQFLSPLDIELANDKSIYVADTVASRVYRIAPGCGSVKIVLDWATDGYIGHPRAVNIADGGLYVADNDRIYFVKLDSNFNVISVTTTPVTLQGVIAMDTSDTDNRLFFIEPGYVRYYNPSNQVLGTYATLRDFGWPDISGIKVTSCGIFLSVTDNNQVWRCSDINNPASCVMACRSENIDSSTCMNIRDPYGITVDCNCDIYSAEQGGGSLVHISSNYTSSNLILGGLYHPYDLEIYESSNCLPTGTSTSTPSSSPSPSATRSVSPSPTVTPNYQLAIRIDDYNTACASGNCGTNDTTALLEASNTRKFGVLYLINFPSTLIQDLGTCFAVSLSGSNIICTRLIDPLTFLTQSYTNIKLYILASGGISVPSYKIAPGVFAANVFPNASSNRVVAAQIPCTGINGVSLRIAIDNPLPCWNDTLFNKVICAEQRSTSQSDASQWANSSGGALGSFVPFHQIVCVS